MIRLLGAFVALLFWAPAFAADYQTFPAPTGWPAILKGTNISGAEFNAGLGKRLNFDYVYPTQQELNYYHSKGFGLIRVPFDICRAYPVANQALDSFTMSQLRMVVDYAGGLGMHVLLDPHNFGYMMDSRISSVCNNSEIGVTANSTALFADFWGQMATLWKNYPNVLFGLMNEPNAQTATQWQAAAATAVAAIRNNGFTGTITIPGTSFSGAHSWVSSGNAAAWTGYTDPGNNFLFEMHEYLDSDYSGTHAVCAYDGPTTLSAATAWLQQTGYKAILAEFAWSTDPTCATYGPDLVNYMTTNSAQWKGWAWWTGGPWYPQTYIFQLDPASFTSPVDHVQMSSLTANLP